MRFFPMNLSPSRFAIAFVALGLAIACASPGWAAAAKDKKPHPAKSKAQAIDTAPPAPAVLPNGMPTIATAARNAIVIDFNSGQVLLDKGADERIPTASMSKIMTAYVVYEYLRDGRAKFDDELPVSEEAWRTGGSKMFVPYPGEVKIDDLLKGMIIQSGNDACIVLAEGLAGSQAAFVERMNQTAVKLGLTNSHFGDVNGLPADGHYMSVRDLATLSYHYIADFPQFYRYEADKEFTFNGIRQGNRNPLLYLNLGADGIKTGHTDEAGYGLVGSAVRQGRRVIIVLAGMSSIKERGEEAEKVLDWSYREFEDVTVAKAGAIVDQAPVWLGVNAVVPVATAKDAVVSVPRAARQNLKISAVYSGPIKAPVTQGERVGTLQVTGPNLTPIEIPLVATTAVAELGPLGRAAESIAHYLWEKEKAN
jgi:serine-type D-Ala-D-Ala carboxypeptidase (penicillin-binding protein 5/6)